MADSTLIDTLHFPEDAPVQQYEIYGDDEKTPTYAVISRRDGDSWQKLDDTLSFAAQDEQEETGTMDYGYSDSMPDLRDLPAEARERCEQHWQKSNTI